MTNEQPTMNLRWHQPSEGSVPELQQEWLIVTTYANADARRQVRTEWRPVPTVR